MPDSKITALTAITTVNPATFPLVIVDTSDTSMATTGTTKKVTTNQLLGAGGTATLASATITGDLTVDTSTLKVDSVNNRVGIGTASPLGPFHLVTTAAGFSEAGYFENSQAVGANVGPRVSLLGAGSVAMSLIQSGWNAAANTDAYLAFLTRGSGGVTERYRIASDGVATWSNVGGVAGTAMTLNATGLGVGLTPSGGAAGSVFSAGAVLAAGGLTANQTNRGVLGYSSNETTIRSYGATAGTGFITFRVAGGGGSGDTEAMRIDASSNVGIGVTPSAWNSSASALEFKNGIALYSFGSGTNGNFITNGFYNSGGSFIYKTSNTATRYQQFDGSHLWFNAPSGTAGTAITFTQAMTLNASGSLLIGQTTAGLDAQGGFWLREASSAFGSSIIINHRTAVGTGNSYAEFTHNGVVIGSISQNGTTGVLYNTTSDYRLKESVQPIANGLARVNALKPSIYKWKADGSNGEGFLAHELAEVVPAAVSGEKDAVNEDGSIKAQGVDMSRVVPILVAAIQELTARVQTLETR